MARLLNHDSKTAGIRMKKPIVIRTNYAVTIIVAITVLARITMDPQAKLKYQSVLGRTRKVIRLRGEPQIAK